MKMYFKTMMVLLFTSCIVSSFAQDTTKTTKKIKECIVSVSNINPLNLALKYKQQLKKRTFFKAEFVNLSGSRSRRTPEFSSNFSDISTGFSGGVLFGLEFRKAITGDFTVFHGPGIGSGYSVSKYKAYDPTQPVNSARIVSEGSYLGVNYTVGVLVHLKGHFFMSAEINPGVSLSRQRNHNPPPGMDSEQYSTVFGLGSTYCLLSLVYRL
jgi:hypothetical protein